jgi:crotonobetainyl-CoA:carnitine CoA-transferase CaiB-like acyl-CoA transferase
MKYSRMPRWLLSCWVANPRPVGAPNFTYGRGVQAALEYAGLGEGDGRWVAQAGDREQWREMLKGLGQEAWEEEQGAADRQQQQQQQQLLQQQQQQTPAQRQQQQQQEQQQQRQLRAYRRQFRGNGGV